MAKPKVAYTRDRPDQHSVVEAIRTRAYELYMERGQVEGHDVDDWLEAEAEILSRQTRRAA